MKTDARVRYTRMRIRKAFFAYLEKKPVSKITVKEICDMAEINRATFYKHYADPFDLLEKTEEEALGELHDSIRDQRQKMPQGMLLKMVKSMQDTENSYALLASQNGDPGFTARIWELFYQEFQPRMAQNLPGCTENERKAAYLFVAGGCGNLISAWIKDGMRTPAEQVASELGKICEAFVKSYGQ